MYEGRPFRFFVPVEQLKTIFYWYDWNGAGLHIAKDWSVGFYKSELNGQPVYYVDHSRIEYVFTKNGRAP